MTVTSTFHMELVNYFFDTRYADIMSSRSGLYPREAFHRLASPQTSFGVRSSRIYFSRIHFYPTDGFSYERVAQFNLEWIFSKLDSGFQSLVGFWILRALFRIPRAKNSWISESGFPYMGRSVAAKKNFCPSRIWMIKSDFLSSVIKCESFLECSVTLSPAR